MQFRILCTVALLMILAQATCGQESPPKVKIHLESPKGWRGETIQLPPSFAPKMVWKGLEEVRFAPGMFDPKKEDFFSYVFVFYVPSQSEPDQKILQRELLTYYRGLASAVARRKGGVDAEAFRMTVRKVDETEEPTSKKTDEKLPHRFVGALSWTEPFATMKPQKLHLEIQSATCKSRDARYLAVAVSPQSPEKAKPLWRSMRGILKTVEFRDASTAKPGTDK